jgi:N-acetylglucosamine-6-phosphate deacetylase
MRMTNDEAQLASVGATAITPFEEIPDSAVVLENNRIVFVGPRGSLPTTATTESIDLSGKFIAPGFIDIHIHGGAGSDFMDATRADFETVCRYHARGGTTSLLATTATAPLPEILAALRTVREVQQNPVSGAQVLGAHIEGPYLSMAKRAATSKSSCVIRKRQSGNSCWSLRKRSSISLWHRRFLVPLNSCVTGRGVGSTFPVATRIQPTVR